MNVEKKERASALSMPIILTMIYLTASVLIYIFGPMEWTTYKPVLFYTLIAAYMTALWVGYRLGSKQSFPKAIEWKGRDEKRWMKLLSALMVVNFLVYLINIFRGHGFASLDFPGLWKQILAGIKDPGAAYFLRVERGRLLSGPDVLGGTAMTAFNYLWAFVRYPILIFSLISFARLNAVGKIFTAAYLVAVVMFYMSIGTNIDIFHVFLLLETGPVITFFSEWYRGDLCKKKAVRFVGSIMAGLLLMAGYFTWMMVSRGGINHYDDPAYNIGGVALKDGVVADPGIADPGVEPPKPAAPGKDTPDNDTAHKLPSIIMKFWISFSAYFTQGYYGMSQAITLPWTPMFGVGNSMFLVDFISEHIADIDRYTYQVKVENAYGWGSDKQWHSIYTWIANDTSFYGVTIVMFLIGMLFSMMFKDAVTTQNPFAKISIFYFLLMVFFIPCNNQLAQRADTLFSFALIVFCWLISKFPPPNIRGWFRKNAAGDDE